MDTSLLAWLYSDKCIRGLKAPNWSTTLIVTWVFILLELGLGMGERELEWLGHMMLQTKHWTLKYTDLYLESAYVHWFGWNVRIQWFWNILNIHETLCGMSVSSWFATSQFCLYFSINFQDIVSKQLIQTFPPNFASKVWEKGYLLLFISAKNYKQLLKFTDLSSSFCYFDKVIKG
jgi:hypothetical protein